MKSRPLRSNPFARATVRRLAAIWFSTGWAALFGLTALTAHAAGASEAAPPAITVSGTSEVFAAPDRAMVSLGAVVEAKQALDAQRQLAQVMQRVIKDIRAQGIPDEKIRTAGLSLNPVYSHPVPKAGQEPEAPRITGYRASNTVRVQVDNLERVGSVIDAGIASGANQLAGLVFDLRDDLPYRKQALQLAAQEARSKAEALATALNLQLGDVLEVREEGGPAVYPVERRFAAPAAAGTPIQPGQVQVNAAVSVRFRLMGPSK
ncbi:MAG: SIMPL domain-containing protein [Hyphomicrobiales bacterium]